MPIPVNDANVEVVERHGSNGIVKVVWNKKTETYEITAHRNGSESDDLILVPHANVSGRFNIMRFLARFAAALNDIRE